MTQKHTPGPWEYEQDNGYHNDRDGIRYVDLSAGAPLESSSRFARIDRGPTSKADARLIAAAPALLAALEGFLHADPDVFQKELEAALDAIAKAKGD